MKKLSTLLMALMLMSSALWADETITVSAKSSDISEGLDLKVVAKLFAEAKNLEEFENILNNPDSAFCNLDLNGDGQVDYLRVIETGEGNKRLIVLQAVLAKDIYQDVASIYVEKDADDQVSVQIIGDEYVYGVNYIIEPVYVYRPVIYDWFWCDAWYAWHSPWYWDYYPGWWYVHYCWAHDWYWHHCYAFHRHHYWCSFRTGHTVRRGYHDLRSNVTRTDYAVTHPEGSFRSRNVDLSNAREIRATNTVRTTRTVAAGETTRTTDGRATASRPTISRTDGKNLSTSRSTATESRTTATATKSTPTTSRSTATASRSTGSTKSTATTTKSTSSTKRSTSTTVSRSTSSSVSSSRTSMSSGSSSSTRSSGSSTRISSGSVGTTRSSGSISGGSRGGGSISSGGGSRGGGSISSGGGSRGGGGGGHTRR